MTPEQRDKRNARQRARYAANPDHHRKVMRDRRRGNPIYMRYPARCDGCTKITHAQREEIIAAQDGNCAICGDFLADGGMHVDHDHDTGVIRGVLCTTCNLALGGFRDAPEILRKAIEYLKGYGKW